MRMPRPVRWLVVAALISMQPRRTARSPTRRPVAAPVSAPARHRRRDRRRGSVAPRSRSRNGGELHARGRWLRRRGLFSRRRTATARSPMQTLTTISLNDLNDNTPSITSSAGMAVDENAAAGTLVGTVLAATWTRLRRTTRSPHGRSAAPASTGSITRDWRGHRQARRGVDRETAASYTLEVKAADAGTPGRFTTQTLTVSLNGGPGRQHAVDHQPGRDGGGRERGRRHADRRRGTGRSGRDCVRGNTIASRRWAAAGSTCSTPIADRRRDGQGRRGADPRRRQATRSKSQALMAAPVHHPNADHHPQRPERQHVVDHQCCRNGGGRMWPPALVGTITASDLDATAPNNAISYAGPAAAGSGCSTSMPRPAR